MTSLTDNLAEFCATRRVHAFAHKLGQGWEVQWSPPTTPDPEQEAFDRWEMSRPPHFTMDFWFWKQWKGSPKSPEKSGQGDLSL